MDSNSGSGHEDNGGAQPAVRPSRKNRYRKSQSVDDRPRKMKRTTMTIVNLPTDILQHILFLLASSTDGAADTARAICSCKLFKQLALDKENLKAVVFDEASYYVSRPSLWQNDSLLNKSAHLGNSIARKIVLTRVNDLLALGKKSLRAVETENEQFREVVPMLASNRRRTRSITMQIRGYIERLESLLSDANWAVLAAEALADGLL